MPGPGYKRKSVRVSEAKDAAQAAVAYAQAAQAAQDAVTYAQAAQATSGAVGYAQAAQAAKTATTTPTPTLVNVVSSIMPDLSPAERLFAPAAIRAGARYNVSPALLMGLIEHESGFDPTYSGPKTPEGRARGATGFLPKTAEQYGVEFGTSKKAIQSQVDGAAKYLSELDVNNDPESALRKYGVGDASYVKPVVKAARHYGPLEQVAAKAAWKFVKSPSDPTAPPRRAPVNTERPAPRRPVRRDPSAPDDGPVNTERPSPQQAIDPDVRRIVAGVKRRVGEIQSGDLQAAPTPQQKQRVRTRLQKAVNRSGGKFLDDTLNPAQQEWARAFAKELGVSLQFAAAEALREGGNGTPGDNNWANIGWTDSGPAAVTKAPEWRDPTTAGKTTAKWIKGEWGDQYDYNPSEGILEIGRLAKSGASEQEIGRQWARSGWASAGAGPLDTYGDVPISEGAKVPATLKRKARETIGPLNTKAILKDVDLSPAKQVENPARRAAVKRAMLGQATKADAKLLGPAATKALMDGGRIVKAPKGGKYKLQAAEMFYDGGGSYYDNGTWTKGQFGGHGDHVHFASEDPTSMLLVIRKAQELGMLQGGSGENPAIDTIDAHTPGSGSFHVQSEPMPDDKRDKRLIRQTGASGPVLGQAVDIAGTPEQMGKMRDWIAAHIGKGAAVVTGPKIKGTDLIVAPRTDPASATTGTTGGVSSSGAGSLPGIGSAAPGGGKKGKQPREVALIDLASQLTPSARLPTARDPRAAEEEDPLVAAFRNFRPSR